MKSEGVKHKESVRRRPGLLATQVSIGAGGPGKDTDRQTLGPQKEIQHNAIGKPVLGNNLLPDPSLVAPRAEPALSARLRCRELMNGLDERANCAESPVSPG